jgi:arsenate reductase
VAYGELEKRIAAFLKLPLETMSTATVAEAARKIHQEAGQ